MKPTNRHGTPVDSVPFLVVSGLTILVCFSFGPLYFLALGLSLTTGLAISALACGFVVVAAYHRFVRTYYPERRSEIPPEDRIRRLVYGAVVGVAFLALLSLPLLIE